MLPLLLMAAIMIAPCFAGEITRIGAKDPEGDWFYDSESGKLRIMTTPQGYSFYLRLTYWEKNNWGNAGLFHGNKIKSTNYMSRLQVYYDIYLLDSIKVPRIEAAKKFPLKNIDSKIIKSVIPVVPDSDIKNPGSLVVYYSFTDGVCVRGSYSLYTTQGYRYLKSWDYGRSVNPNNCVS